MKKWLLCLFFVYLFMGIVSASVVVHNYSIDDVYSPFELIKGEINLTIVGEDYDTKITSNDGDEVKINDFLDTNGAIFQCSPPDCSKDYKSLGGGTDKNFDIPYIGEGYVGFVLTGENISVDSLNFTIKSNFKESYRRPISINFFGNENWEFNKFSDSFLEKNWGCYNQMGTPGPWIGKSSSYCEMISVEDSKSIYIGADAIGTGNAEFKMAVYPETGIGAPWECSYNPNIENGCKINAGTDEIFSKGNYQVCVGSDASTDYRIYKEEDEINCGFTYTAGPEESVKDYAIFAQTLKYANADSLDSSDFNNEKIVEAANNLIAERYKGDCSGGCILPLTISGVSQNLRIYNIQLAYIDKDEEHRNDKIYELDAVPVEVDFDGILDLNLLGFSVSKTMNYTLLFDDIELLEKKINILPAPIILSLFPLNPPASVPVTFYAEISSYSEVDFDKKQSLVYKWDFGDNSTVETDVPLVSHSYTNLKNYTLSLEVIANGNLSSKKKFNIETISPELAVNTELILKKRTIEEITSVVESFPSWYGEALLKLIDVVSFGSEIDRLDRARNNSFSEQDFVKIAKELYALNIPKRIDVNSFEAPFLLTNLEDVGIEPVVTISGDVSGSNNENYANAILNWQNENIDVNFIMKEFMVSLWNGKSDKIFSTYSFEVSSKSHEESYFVINRLFSELYFKKDVGARKAGDSTIIILEPESEKIFEFYYKDGGPTTFFVSPKLSSIVVEDDIDTTCNYNSICEKENGENSDNCRSDCKPTNRAILYLVLSLMFIFFIYSILQIWYKHHYENYLFKDSNQLYNLLMFVANARARGMKDSRIGAELRAKGWSSERVNYIIKKSKGDRTGLYEIVPFEKILAYFRNRKAKKSMMAKINTTTKNKQQTKRNINKSEFQRRV